MRNSSKTASLMKIMRLLIPKTANVADLENKIKFISNSSPSIVFIEKIQNIVANKITKTNQKKFRSSSI
jgi:hypothetical protein